jgi:OOP family OmpA-OmpF porin
MDRSTWMLFALGSCGAIAATPSLPAETGFYLSAGLGRAEEDPGRSAGINISIGFPPPGIIHLKPDRVEVDGGDTAWSIGAGYRFTRYLAAEVEYMDLGTTDITEYYSYNLGPIIDFAPFSYSSSLEGPAVSILGLIPLGGGFEGFVRGGVLFADREISTRLMTDAGSTTFGDTVWLGGIGVDWSFAGHWALRAEYALTGDLDSTTFAGETAAESLSLRLRYAF